MLISAVNNSLMKRERRGPADAVHRAILVAPAAASVAFLVSQLTPLSLDRSPRC